MSKYIPGNQKHLTLDDRLYIESFLNNGTSFKDIARFLCKAPTQPATNPVRISLRNVVQGSIQPLTFVMDTVHSSRESTKTLLTFFFTESKLFLAFLMNRNTEGAVRLLRMVLPKGTDFSALSTNTYHKKCCQTGT